MTTSTTTETTAAFAASQTVVPAWMQDVIDIADARGTDVRVTRQVTPFGTFVRSVTPAR